MIDEIRGLVDDYSQWLRNNHGLREVGAEYVEITTPFLDRNNDHLQIYVRRVADGFLLTDAGETIADLRLSGCEINTPKRENLLKEATNGFAVQIANEELQVTATATNFASRKHNLVQAMLAVNDLFHLAAPTVASLFYEDVRRWLEAHDVRSLPNVRFVGKSGLDQQFDCAIPASRVRPERLIKVVSHPDRERITAVTFAWEDTKETRSPGSRCLAIVNDIERKVRPDLLAAFRNYEITPIRWSERDQALPELLN